MDSIRIGQGFDAHRFQTGRDLVLGGVKIPHGQGLAGHSDADVLIHAVIDAILGALALGDIGGWFPDTDGRFKDADSGALLATVLRSPQLRGWRLANLDATVICQQPRLAPHAAAIRARLAEICGVGPERISVKGKTTEGMGFTGRGEGIAAQAVVLLEKGNC